MTGAESLVKSRLPLRAGVGLKPEQYRAVLDMRPDIGWFKVSARGLMDGGGRLDKHLTRIRCDYPVSLHGIGKSPDLAWLPDRDHLERLRMIVERYQPASISENLDGFTDVDGCRAAGNSPAYSLDSLAAVCAQIDQIQSRLARRILLGNSRTCARSARDDFEEIEFLREAAARTGCGLLVDLGQVLASCLSRGADPYGYLDRFPANYVCEIHLAGHAKASDDHGKRPLPDCRDREVIDEVWDLFAHFTARFGACPTLVDWGDEVPAWAVLIGEARKADALLRTSGRVSQFRRPYDAVA